MNTTFKYMTFNSSCSYAGLANMLLRYGVDTQDREIAMDMKLPFLFAYEEGEYRAGPMLQGARSGLICICIRGALKCGR